LVAKAVAVIAIAIFSKAVAMATIAIFIATELWLLATLIGK
jgi:hypothetical protein